MKRFQWKYLVSSPRVQKMGKKVSLALPRFLLLLILVLTTGNFLHYAGSLLIYPFDWDSAEGYCLYQSWRVARGDPLYKDLQVYPLMIDNYPPVFFLIGAALLKLSGLVFWPLRLLSTLSALLAGGLIFLIIRSETKSPFWALAGAMLFFISPLSASFVLPMIRVDSLALALSLAGLWLIQRGAASSWSLFASGICFLLAVYTKQTAFPAVLAGWIWLIWRQPLRGFLMGIALALSGGLIFLALQFATQGEFYRQLFGLNIGVMVPGQAWGLFMGFYTCWGIFFTLAVTALIVGLKVRGPWSLFFLLSLSNGLFAARLGATSLYYLPVIAATAIICGISASQLERFGNNLSRNRWVLRAL